MSHEKGSTEEHPVDAETSDEKKKVSSASRARNRTVMLTPEMTGQVRALLQESTDEGAGTRPEGGRGDPLEDFLPPLTDWENPGEAESGQPESSASIGNEGSTGRFGRVDEEPYANELGSAGGYDPMTSVAPSLSQQARPSQPSGAPFGEPEADLSGSRSQQPSFSVNRAVPVGNQAAPRAPRTKSEAVGRCGPVAAQKTKVVGFLVSYDKDPFGEVYDIRTGRWLLTSRPTDHGDYILVNDETISPLHAIVRATKDGKIQILDQLSEFGTGVVRAGEQDEVEVAGGLETVGHGDTVRFGERHFVVCLIPEGAKPSETEDEDSEMEDGEKE